MKEKILALLRRTTGYISGQELCRQLGVSRTAVWKAVNGLKSEGYEIEAVQNRGYRLVSVPDVLSEKELLEHMDTKWAGRVVEAHARISYSTNLRAKQLGDEGKPQGTLVVADVQENGKGRRGRAWVAPVEGTNIAMSLLLRPEIKPTQASMLTLVAAMAVRDGIAGVSGLEAEIKWPNDIVIHGKKVCGILTEMTLEEADIQYVIVGIGINVHNESFEEELADKATSLLLETGRRFSRAELAAAVMKAFEGYYESFVRDGDLRSLMDSYNSCLAARNQEVYIVTPTETRAGISRGIDAGGSLLVEHEDGTLESVIGGEVSVRGIYGYI